MTALGLPSQMGNVPAGTKLLLLAADGITQTIYTVPSGVPPFTDLANAYQYSLVRIIP
jgi:hypothetical protein